MPGGPTDEPDAWETTSVVPHSGRVTQAEHVRDRLWRRRVVAVTLGELAGFTIPSIVGGVAWALDTPPVAFYATLVCAGACEGAVLASAQWIVLRDVPPTLSARRWITATAAAAALAWSLGMLPLRTRHSLRVSQSVLPQA